MSEINKLLNALTKLNNYKLFYKYGPVLGIRTFENFEDSIRLYDFEDENRSKEQVYFRTINHAILELEKLREKSKLQTKIIYALNEALEWLESRPSAEHRDYNNCNWEYENWKKQAKALFKELEKGEAK